MSGSNCKQSNVFELKSSNIGIVNRLRETDDELEVDWTIVNFLQRLDTAKDWNARSPLIAWSSIFWQLEIIYTSGNEIRLFLQKYKSEDKISVALKFGIRLRDGTSEMRSYHTKNFNTASCSWGSYEFILESELLRRKNELMPAGNLTLSCSIVLRDSMIQSKKRKYEDPEILSSDMMSLFENSTNSDLTIVIGEQSYPVHKAILTARSDVFAAMLKHNMEEANSGIINITDCDPTSFKDFLLYLYTAKVEKFSLDKAFNLYNIGDKYNVQGLKNLCVDYIILKLSVLNFSDVAVLASQFNDIKLTCATESYFIWNFAEITESVEFERFVKENYPLANKYLRKVSAELKTLQNGK